MKRETLDYDLILQRYERGSAVKDIHAIRGLIREVPSLRGEIARLKKRNELLGSLVAEVPELLADYAHLAPDADGKTDPARKKRITQITRLLEKIDPPQVVPIFTGADLVPAKPTQGETK